MSNPNQVIFSVCTPLKCPINFNSPLSHTHWRSFYNVWTLNGQGLSGAKFTVVYVFIVNISNWVNEDLISKVSESVRSFLPFSQDLSQQFFF